jgi:flagellar basal-body rod protein FlgF
MGYAWQLFERCGHMFVPGSGAMSNNTSNLVLLSGQIALSQAMDVVANNIANSSTTGYKREGVAFDTLLSRGASNNNKPANFVYDRNTYRDMANGPILNTGNPLDLAIQGPGYFQVQLPNGQTGYTRGGALKLDTDGQIVTQAGLPVLGDGGGSITIPSTASEINISGDGFISARVDNGTSLAQIGQIKIVKFDDDQKLQPAGNGVYSTAQDPQPAGDSAIDQFSIEQSNVEPVIEITDMIRIMRSYEQMTNMISNENQRQADAINRLAKTSSA